MSELDGVADLLEDLRLPGLLFPFAVRRDEGAKLLFQPPDFGPRLLLGLSLRGGLAFGFRRLQQAGGVGSGMGGRRGRRRLFVRGVATRLDLVIVPAVGDEEIEIGGGGRGQQEE